MNNITQPIPATDSTQVNQDYLCQIQQLKSQASFIFAVLGLTLSNLVRFVLVTVLNDTDVLLVWILGSLHLLGRHGS